MDQIFKLYQQSQSKQVGAALLDNNSDTQHSEEAKEKEQSKGGRIMTDADLGVTSTTSKIVSIVKVLIEDENVDLTLALLRNGVFECLLSVLSSMSLIYLK